MKGSLLKDAFDHHVWATLRLTDACTELSSAQLETAAPGTYGSILETMRHLVGADSSYLYVTSGERTARIDEETMDLKELRAAMEANGAAWSTLLAEDLDPDKVFKSVGRPFAIIDCFCVLDDRQIGRYLELGCEVKGMGRGHIKRIKDSFQKGA